MPAREPAAFVRAAVLRVVSDAAVLPVWMCHERRPRAHTHREAGRVRCNPKLRRTARFRRPSGYDVVKAIEALSPLE